jgi:hypothetical protein
MTIAFCLVRNAVAFKKFACKKSSLSKTSPISEKKEIFYNSLYFSVITKFSWANHYGSLHTSTA